MRIKSAQQPRYIKRALAAQNQAPLQTQFQKPNCFAIYTASPVSLMLLLPFGRDTTTKTQRLHKTQASLLTTAGLCFEQLQQCSTAEDQGTEQDLQQGV